MYEPHDHEQLKELHDKANLVAGYIHKLREKLYISGQPTIMAETGTVELFLNRLVKWVMKQQANETLEQENQKKIQRRKSKQKPVKTDVPEKNNDTDKK